MMHSVEFFQFSSKNLIIFRKMNIYHIPPLLQYLDQRETHEKLKNLPFRKKSVNMVLGDFEKQSFIYFHVYVFRSFTQNTTQKFSNIKIKNK